MLLPQILSVQIICTVLKPVNCLLWVLVSRRQSDKHLNLLLMLYPYCLNTEEAGTTTQQSKRVWEHGTTFNELHACHVALRCEPPGAPV